MDHSQNATSQRVKIAFLILETAHRSNNRGVSMLFLSSPLWILYPLDFKILNEGIWFCILLFLLTGPCVTLLSFDSPVKIVKLI